MVEAIPHSCITQLELRNDIGVNLDGNMLFWMDGCYLTLTPDHQSSLQGQTLLTQRLLGTCSSEQL